MFGMLPIPGIPGIISCITNLNTGIFAVVLNGCVPCVRKKLFRGFNGTYSLPPVYLLFDRNPINA